MTPPQIPDRGQKPKENVNLFNSMIEQREGMSDISHFFRLEDLPPPHSLDFC